MVLCNDRGTCSDGDDADRRRDMQQRLNKNECASTAIQVQTAKAIFRSRLKTHLFGVVPAIVRPTVVSDAVIVRHINPRVIFTYLLCDSCVSECLIGKS